MKKLGFGFMRLPVLDEKDRSTVDIEAVKKMVDLYMERGFTYYDTAHRYNDEASEPAIREALVKRYPRDSFVLANKITMLSICGVDYSRKCYETAREYGKRIVVMDPVKGGTLVNLPEAAAALIKEADPHASFASWAIRFAAGLEGVYTVLSGMTTLDQVKGKRNKKMSNLCFGSTLDLCNFRNPGICDRKTPQM